jgi:hypothetical protein
MPAARKSPTLGSAEAFQGKAADSKLAGGFHPVRKSFVMVRFEDLTENLAPAKPN